MTTVLLVMYTFVEKSRHTIELLLMKNRDSQDECTHLLKEKFDVRSSKLTYNQSYWCKIAIPRTTRFWLVASHGCGRPIVQAMMGLISFNALRPPHHIRAYDSVDRCAAVH